MLPSDRETQLARIEREAESLANQLKAPPEEAVLGFNIAGPDIPLGPFDDRHRHEASLAHLADLERGLARLQGSDLTLETWQRELEEGTAMVRVAAPVALGEDLPGVSPAEEDVLRPPSYFVGRGIVSESEIEDVVKGYYRWTEASLNLVLPTFAMGVAVYLSSTRWGGLILILAVVFAFVLSRAARRRHRDYKDRLREFLEGRLKRYAEESQQKEKAKTMDEVVQEAKKLLAELKKQEE